MSSVQEIWQTLSPLIALGLIVGMGILSAFLMERIEKVKKLQSSFKKLNHSFNELDEQAKLIVKTDLELNKAQEELDKRLTGLDALHKVSRLISTTLDEGEIFRRLNQPLLTELGFEKHLVLIFDPYQQLQCHVDFGFTAGELNSAIDFLQKNMDFVNSIRDKQIISSIREPKETQARLIKAFNVKHFVIAPILDQKDMLGVVFTGNRSDAFAITEGDEELISILADQIGQAIKNARLFEQAYRASQQLEVKVRERTRQLSTALEEVQRISNTKSEFVSAVSHELRTPLTSIKGYAAILMTGKVGEIPDKVKERLEKINKHSDNLVQLINNLLDISRIESGKTEMNFTEHSIPKIVENVHDILMPQIKDKNVTFEAKIADNIPKVLMDPTQIERVFINLIGNAIKFTPEKGRITVEVKVDDDEVACVVSDTGIGIDEDSLKKLFNEFYRVENEINQNVKGSGLGLALVKKIIEAHSGRIWVASQVHKGSQFHFTLPKDPKQIKGT